MTGHKQKVNKILVLDLFPFHLVQGYHLVEEFSWTPRTDNYNYIKIPEQPPIRLLLVVRKTKDTLPNQNIL